MLAVFVAVIEQGSFSKAALHLETNQSTVSTVLAKLKQEVGQDLFVRQGQGVVPTAFALSLYEQIRDPVSLLTNVFSAMGSFDPTTSDRKFTLSLPEHLQWVMVERFAEQANPKLRLEVFDQPMSDHVLFDELLTQKYDAIVDVTVPDHPSIQSIKLFDSDFVMVCRASHPRIQGKLSFEQYLTESHALLERQRNDLYSLARYTKSDLSKRKVSYHGHSLFSNMLFCSRTDALTVVPLSMALQLKQQLNLQILPPPFEYQPISNYLIWLKKSNGEPGHIWFREMLIQAAHQWEAQSADYLG